MALTSEMFNKQIFQSRLKYGTDNGLKHGAGAVPYCTCICTVSCRTVHVCTVLKLFIKQFLTPNPYIVEGSIEILGDCRRFAKLQSV